MANQTFFERLAALDVPEGLPAPKTKLVELVRKGWIRPGDQIFLERDFRDGTRVYRFARFEPRQCGGKVALYFEGKGEVRVAGPVDIIRTFEEMEPWLATTIDDELPWNELKLWRNGAALATLGWWREAYLKLGAEFAEEIAKGINDW
ncbi:hypothetical protein MMC19_004862 [Ptychographa xylographoides]|nr:hypothetical protein [Ptychographa xylographoides]